MEEILGDRRGKFDSKICVPQIKNGSLCQIKFAKNLRTRNKPGQVLVNSFIAFSTLYVVP